MLRKTIPLQLYRQFSQAAVAPEYSQISELSNKREVFENPQLLTPSFELTRKLGTVLSQTIYSIFYEKNFSVESLVRGANQGVNLVANHYANRDYEKMTHLVSKEIMEELKLERDRLSPELENALKFKMDDYILSFVHSTVIAGKNTIKLSAQRNMGIYFTTVSYVRLNEKVPDNATIGQLNSKYKGDVLICNSTFSRVLNPLGVWKITGLNYFL